MMFTIKTIKKVFSKQTSDTSETNFNETSSSDGVTCDNVVINGILRKAHEVIIINGVKFEINNAEVKVIVEKDASSVVTANGSVTVNGNVMKNVESLNGEITCYGHVSGDIRSEIGEIHVEGNVSGNVSSNIGDIKIINRRKTRR